MAPRVVSVVFKRAILAGSEDRLETILGRASLLKKEGSENVHLVFYLCACTEPSC